MRETALRHALVLFTTLGFSGSLTGETLVKDINAAPPEGTASSSPTGFTVVGDRAYFVATDAFGPELWSTDGTAAGTARVKDISPGPTGSAPAGFAALPNGVVIFAAGDGDTGTEPWRTDGTDAGTYSLGDLRPGGATSGPVSFVALGSHVFFFANDGIHGFELWRTDGTVAGTTLVADIVPGVAGVHSADLCVSGGALYFGAQVPGSGHALLRSDGTAAGTFALKMVTNGAFHYLEELTDVGGVLLFRATDPLLGKELWRSDGTPAGTTVLKDLAPGGVSSDPKNMFRVGDRVFFSASHPAMGQELWVTDGHATGTFPVADISAGALFGSEPSPVGAIGSHYIFSAATWGQGRELWASDGTLAGTHLIANIAPLSTSSNPSLGVALGGKLYFSANDGTRGPELWVTDGTSTGTHLVVDITPGPDTLPVHVVAALGTDLLLSADDAIHGREPWVSDGTAAGTKMLSDIHTHALSASSSPKDLTRVGERLFFSAETDHDGRELWTSDGTAAGTTVVTSINPGPTGTTLGGFDAIGDKLFFFASDGIHGLEPWVSDGTAAGTQLLLDVFPGFGDSNWGFSPTAVLDDRLFFSAVDAVFFGQLFVTDGTPAGTSVFSSLVPVDMRRLGDRVVMSAGTSATGTELYVIDGADQAPKLLKDILPGASSGIWGAFIAATDTRAWFMADDGVNGFELWTTDGTAAGTNMVADLTTGALTTTIYDVAPLGDEAILHTHDFTNGHRILVTDGSPAGVKTLATLGLTDPLSGLFTAGDVTFFYTGNSNGVWKFWRTDGTVAGTARIEGDLQPVYPAVFEVPGSGGRMVISARRIDVGVELFVSDGNTTEPTLVADVAPGAFEADAHDLVRVGAHVFFVADDATHGEELHSLPLAAFGEFATESFGDGFAPSGLARPTFDAIGPVVAGQPFSFDVELLPASSPVLLLVAGATAHDQLPGVGVLHLAAPFVGLSAMSDSKGSFPVAAQIPPTLVGARAVLQAFSTVGNGVLVGSPGLEIVVGP